MQKQLRTVMPLLLPIVNNDNNSQFIMQVTFLASEGASPMVDSFRKFLSFIHANFFLGVSFGLASTISPGNYRQGKDGFLQSPFLLPIMGRNQIHNRKCVSPFIEWRTHIEWNTRNTIIPPSWSFGYEGTILAYIFHGVHWMKVQFICEHYIQFLCVER